VRSGLGNVPCRLETSARDRSALEAGFGEAEIVELQRTGIVPSDP